MPEWVYAVGFAVLGAAIVAVFVYLISPRERPGSFHMSGKVGIGGVEFDVTIVQTEPNQATLQLVGTNDESAKLGIPTVVQTTLSITRW